MLIFTKFKPTFRRSWPIGLVVLYTLALAITAAVGTTSNPVPPTPFADLLDKPLGEDAFYMLSVARNLGTGHGMSYGGVATSGVQPLATYMYASIYWLSAHAHLRDTASLRLILIVNVVLLIVTGCLTGAWVKRWTRRNRLDDREAFWIGATIVVVNPAAFRLFG
jgi:hypothetical protein